MYRNLRRQFIGFTLIEQTYKNPLPSIRQKSLIVAKPSGKIIFGEWLSNHSPIDGDAGWWCWEGSRNYLFADGQVRLVEAGKIRPARDGFPDANLTINGIKGLDWPAKKEAVLSYEF